MFHHTERMCDKHWTISSGQRSGGWFEHVVNITNIFRMIWMMTIHCDYHHNCHISARDAKCTWHGNLLFLTIIFKCLHSFRASAAYFSPFVLPDKQKCSDNKMQKVPGWGWDDEALMSGVTEPWLCCKHDHYVAGIWHYHVPSYSVASYLPLIWCDT